jgi:hypothetical protein
MVKPTAIFYGPVGFLFLWSWKEENYYSQQITGTSWKRSEMWMV